MPSQQELKAREKELFDYAYGIVARYHPFIDALPQRANIDGQWVNTTIPYFNAEGMKLAAFDEHDQHGAKLSMTEPKITELRDRVIVTVGILSELYGTFYGTSGADLTATKGAEANYPVEVAETGALRRALDHMGYSFHNPFVRGQLSSVAPQPTQTEESGIAEVASAKMTELAGIIQEKGIGENDSWTALSLISFESQAELDREIRHQSSLDKLTPKVFGSMVRAFMAETGVTDAACREHLNGKTARDLNLEEQINLIQWIKSHIKQEEELPSEVAKMVAYYADYYKVEEDKIISGIILHANEEGATYSTLQAVPIEKAHEILKNDDLMKAIAEDVTNE